MFGERKMGVATRFMLLESIKSDQPTIKANSIITLAVFETHLALIEHATLPV
jgi:hypothetical protein